jgi:hypothetical protein
MAGHMVARADGDIAAPLICRKIPARSEKKSGAIMEARSRRNIVSGRGGTVYSIDGIWQRSPFRVLAGGLNRRHVRARVPAFHIRRNSLIPQMKSGVALEA